jgi:hypothetical protein
LGFTTAILPFPALSGHGFIRRSSPSYTSSKIVRANQTNRTLTGRDGCSHDLTRTLAASILRRISEGCSMRNIIIVDTREKIDDFLGLVDTVIDEGIATLEEVRIHFYRAGKQSPPVET